jgi:hypothetical protein
MIQSAIGDFITGWKHVQTRSACLFFMLPVRQKKLHPCNHARMQQNE